MVLILDFFNNFTSGGVRAAGCIYSKFLKNPGRVSLDLMHVTDWLPTLVSLAGGGGDLKDLDGMNVWKTLQAMEPSPRTEILINIDAELYHNSALRVGDWKLVNQSMITIFYFTIPLEVYFCMNKYFHMTKLEMKLKLYSCATRVHVTTPRCISFMTILTGFPLSNQQNLEFHFGQGKLGKAREFCKKIQRFGKSVTSKASMFLGALNRELNQWKKCFGQLEFFRCVLGCALKKWEP